MGRLVDPSVSKWLKWAADGGAVHFDAEQCLLEGLTMLQERGFAGISTTAAQRLQQGEEARIIASDLVKALRVS